jgi:hypothetical protein
MSHVFEPAVSGRSKCRGCGKPIARAEVRFGERMLNLFGEGESTLWFHPLCAAYKRPQSVLDSLGDPAARVADRDRIERAARASASHRRRPRIDGAERAPGSQAHCRQCRELILKDTWRIRLVFYEEGYFSPGGFIHLACRKPYFETDDVLEQVLYFSSKLSAEDREELRRAWDAGPRY